MVNLAVCIDSLQATNCFDVQLLLNDEMILISGSLLERWQQVVAVVEVEGFIPQR